MALTQNFSPKLGLESISKSSCRSRGFAEMNVKWLPIDRQVTGSCMCVKEHKQV